MDDVGKLRQQEQQAYDVLVRLRQLRDAMPADHPSLSVLQQAIARAVVYWHGLQTDRQALERAQQERQEARD